MIEYRDRKAFLESVKMVFNNFTNNINHGQNASNPIKIIDYVKNIICQLMLQIDARMKKKSTAPNYMISSESESDSQNQNSTQIQLFMSIIDEFLGTDGKKTAWHNAFVQAKGNKGFTCSFDHYN